MPEAIGGILPIIMAGTAGTGLVGNILSSIQKGRVASEAEKNANLSPTQLGTMVQGATQPLDRGLVETVQNSVQGDMASRGLAEAPGVFAASESQALAPFEQQNQNTALQLILQKLGLPAQTLAALNSGGSANMSPLLMLMMQMMNKNKASTTVTPPPAQTPGTPGITPGGDWSDWGGTGGPINEGGFQ